MYQGDMPARWNDRDSQ
ncbi:hypothetical protein KIPB_014745, partial [Kipferlia bialata]|eukprot:g14745.t1